MKYSKNLGNKYFLSSVRIKSILVFKISDELIDLLSLGMNTEMKFK